MKVESTKALALSFKESIWAIPLRKTSPQPFEIVNRVFEDQEREGQHVIFVISTSGTKKYQGWAIMQELIHSDGKHFEGLANDVSVQTRLTKPFLIKWICKYPEISLGLSFENTKHLTNPLDKNQPVNNSRNVQEIPANIGKEICELLLKDVHTVEAQFKEREERKNYDSTVPFHEIYTKQLAKNEEEEEEEEHVFPSDDFELELKSLQYGEGNDKFVKERIRDVVTRNEFLDFITSPETIFSKYLFVIGIVPSCISNELESKSRIVLLSHYTVLKGRSKHKDINVDDYLQVQDMFDHSEAIREARDKYPRHIVFYKKVGEQINKSTSHIAVAIKCTQSGDELYLQTLYCASDREIARSRQRGKILRKVTE